MNNEQKNDDLILEQNRLLQRNIELSEKILEKTIWMRNYLKWQRIWGFFSLFFIIIPIILSFIYLPPIVKEYLEGLSNLYNK